MEECGWIRPTLFLRPPSIGITTLGPSVNVDNEWVTTQFVLRESLRWRDCTRKLVVDDDVIMHMCAYQCVYIRLTPPHLRHAFPAKGAYGRHQFQQGLYLHRRQGARRDKNTRQHWWWRCSHWGTLISNKWMRKSMRWPLLAFLLAFLHRNKFHLVFT